MHIILGEDSGRSQGPEGGGRKETKQRSCRQHTMKKTMSVNDRVQAGSDRIEHCLERNDLSEVLVPHWKRKTGPCEAVVTSILTALDPRDFRDEVRENLRRRTAADEPDRVLRITGGVKDKHAKHEAVDIGRMVTAKGNHRQASNPQGKN